MFLRNLTMFVFPPMTDFSEIDKLLPDVQLKPVGPLEMCSRGFISPFGREEKEVLHHQSGDWIWLTVGGETKMLPGSVVNDKLAKKIQEIEETDGRKPGGRERKRIKDDILHELMPQAFVKSSRTDVYLNTAKGVAFVDTSSRRTGENVMSDIRGLLGSFPAMPLNAEVAPRSVMTGWIAGEDTGGELTLGEACEMKDPAEGGAVVKCQYQELRCDEIDKHLDAGKQVTKLALIKGDELSFVLGDDLIVRSLKFLDGALDKLDHADDDGRRAELDARFHLQIGELGQLFEVLRTAFKLTMPEDETELQKANRQRPQTAFDKTEHTPETLRKAALVDGAQRTREVKETEADPLYQPAINLVQTTGKVSISNIQRALEIGYNRAARLVEAMEANGLVSVPDMTGTRTVTANAQAEEA